MSCVLLYNSLLCMQYIKQWNRNCLAFRNFSFGHCVVCFSSIYGFCFLFSSLVSSSSSFILELHQWGSCCSIFSFLYSSLQIIVFPFGHCLVRHSSLYVLWLSLSISKLFKYMFCITNSEQLDLYFTTNLFLVLLVLICVPRFHCLFSSS